MGEEESQASHYQYPLHSCKNEWPLTWFDSQTSEAFSKRRAPHETNALEDSKQLVESRETGQTKELVVRLGALGGQLNELERKSREEVNQEPALDIVKSSLSAVHDNLASFLGLSEASHEIQHNIHHEEAIHDPVHNHPPERSAVFKGHTIGKSECCVHEQ